MRVSIAGKQLAHDGSLREFRRVGGLEPIVGFGRVSESVEPSLFMFWVLKARLGDISVMVDSEHLSSTTVERKGD